jgi:hypothetical protein
VTVLFEAAADSLHQASTAAAPAPTAAARPPRFALRSLVAVLLLAILAGNVLLRWRFIEMPLERDEGEYAYAGQMLLRGHPPYERAYNMKMPGIYLAYAGLLAIFGETHQGIHRGLVIINTLTVLLVYCLGQRIFGRHIGLFAAAGHAIHSVLQTVLGFTANAEHFVLLPALAAILLLLHAIDSRRWSTLLLSGLLFGIAFLMKQHGMFFGFFAGVYLLWRELEQRPIAWLGLLARGLVLLGSACLPFGLTCLWLWREGVFDNFWFWVVDYAAAYVTQVSPLVGIGWFPQSWLVIAESCFVFWGLCFIGLDAVCRWDVETRHGRRFLTLFTIFSFLATCPGWWFRDHYFILTLPAAAIAAGVGVDALARRLARAPSQLWRGVRFVALAIFALGTPLWVERLYLFKWTMAEIAVCNYYGNPVTEALVLAEYLNKNTTYEDTIAILGSEPQIFFYADRYSATGHIYVYALMERQPYAPQMQREMIAQIESARPKFVLHVDVESSWTPWPESDYHILRWWADYRREYERVGVVELFRRPARYYWDEAARRYVLPNDKDLPWVAVYRRKDASS